MSCLVISHEVFLYMKAVPHRESKVTHTFAFFVNYSGTFCWSRNSLTHFATSP